MLERFTDGARAVVYLAIEEANERGHDCVGVEHVFLGLLGEEDGVAAQVLRSLGVTDERVRARLSETVPASAQGPSPQGPFPLPFTPRARGVLELALREALSYGSRFVGTEHILLGLVGEHEGVAAQVLREFDVDAAKIRNAIPAPLPGSRTVVREEPGGPLVVRVARIGREDRPEGGGERADVEQIADERAGEQQRVASSSRLIDSLDPAAAESCVTCVDATVKLQSSVSAELAGVVKDDRGSPTLGSDRLREFGEPQPAYLALGAGQHRPAHPYVRARFRNQRPAPRDLAPVARAAAARRARAG